MKEINRRSALALGATVVAAPMLAWAAPAAAQKYGPTDGVHFAHYNLVRVHKTLRVTPAMAAGVSDRLWSLEELVERTS